MDKQTKAESLKEEVRQVLITFLEQNKFRKTPERFAILDAVYSFSGNFTIKELEDKLTAENFHVSRATLYNTLNLFMRLRLVIYQRTLNKTSFRASYSDKRHAHVICSVCGKITDINSPAIDQAVADTPLRRFRREGYSLYIYGVCSMCQAKITRRKKELQKKAEKKKLKKKKT